MSTPTSGSIYLLRDPEDGRVRYIGWTVRPLHSRLEGHLKRSGGVTHRSRWLQKLIEKGLRPTIELVETVQIGTHYEEEKKWIAHFRGQGCDLTNATDGGQGSLGCKQSQETIAKRVASRKGYRHSEETKRKISDSNKGQIPATAGKPLPMEVRSKISKTLEGHEVSPETREKISASGLGRRHSSETRTKMSQSHKGVPRSEETKEKMRAGWARRKALRAMIFSFTQDSCGK